MGKEASSNQMIPQYMYQWERKLHRLR